MKRTPHFWRVTAMVYEEGVAPETLRRFRRFLEDRFGKGKEGIRTLNAALGTSFPSYAAVNFPLEDFSGRRSQTQYDSRFLKVVLEFKNTLRETDFWWTDPDASFAAFLRNRVSRDLEELNRKLGTGYTAWSDISLNTGSRDQPEEFEKIRLRYVREGLNSAFLRLAPEARKNWQEYLLAKYKTVSELNRVHKTDFRQFGEIPLSLTEPPSGEWKADWLAFVAAAAPPEFLRFDTLASEYRTWLKKKYGALEQVNRVYENGWKNFKEIPLSAECPKNNLHQTRDYLLFIESLSPRDVGLQRNAITEYRDFIAALYTVPKTRAVDFQKISHEYGRKIQTPSEIPFFTTYPLKETESARTHYERFVRNSAHAPLRLIPNPSAHRDSWHRFLAGKYGTVDRLNEAWGLVCTQWEKIVPPVKEFEWFVMLDRRKDLIREYLTRNYRMVFDTILTHGNAAKNTLIYCVLAVVTALIVNPLCAYALSRYKMAPAYKILLFVMLPMAFPAMVLGIPQFLLIKNLGLLNTFAALILPGMANGYSIFLLKGFFDSLPKELFESATLDGAGEWTIFWHIAMGLSTPILSVIALGAFTAAYGNFMMAFLLCQDQSMWTMMVYLYQLQQRTSQAVGFAALIVAAVPTLLVFIFCQNIIIRGIVVPQEK
ncbi:MAG: Lactose transport system permease protein LacG [Lentisphaerae bacterium ADurb.Bin242]|nr:MAG: Lactose transport system permease protein LacG [Lentisphaerae bacterium ADurb.Bin242]